MKSEIDKIRGKRSMAVDRRNAAINRRDFDAFYELTREIKELTKQLREAEGRQRIVFEVVVDVDAKVNFPDDWIQINATAHPEMGKIVKIQTKRIGVAQLNKDFRQSQCPHCKTNLTDLQASDDNCWKCGKNMGN